MTSENQRRIHQIVVRLGELWQEDKTLVQDRNSPVRVISPEELSSSRFEERHKERGKLHDELRELAAKA